MQIHIWQQFSSNHSVDFTVVGTFDSEAKAIEVEGIFQEMFSTILEWRKYERNVPNDYIYQIESGHQPPTFPETEYAQKYNVEWKESLDWLGRNNIARIDNHLFITTNWETHQYPDVILALMRHFTDSVSYSQGDSGVSFLLVEVSCNAPDAETVSRLYKILDPYFETLHDGYGDDYLPPWSQYEDRKRRINKTSQYSQTEKDLLLTLFEVQQAIRWQRSNLPELVSQATTLFNLANDCNVTLTEADVATLAKEYAHWTDSLTFGGKIEVSNLQIHFPVLYFAEAYKALPIVFRFLEALDVLIFSIASLIRLMMSCQVSSKAPYSRSTVYQSQNPQTAILRVQS